MIYNSLEYIACVPKKGLIDFLKRNSKETIYHELKENDKDALISFINDSLVFIQRKAAENSTTHVQIIPYITFIKNDIENNVKSVFAYKRTKSGQENRLYDALSCGFGGHIDAFDLVTCSTHVLAIPHKDSEQDNTNSANFINPIIYNNMLRELYEEVLLMPDDLSMTPRELVLNSILSGIIYGESSAVDAVHLGLHYVIELNVDALISSVDPAIGKFFTIQIGDNQIPENMENWSKLALDFLNHYYEKPCS